MRKSTSDAVSEWREMAELRAELCEDTYAFQDDKTQAVIDRVSESLLTGTPTVIGRGHDVSAHKTHLADNARFVAVEVLKDLAMFDIRVESFRFLPGQCVNCGGAS